MGAYVREDSRLDKVTVLEIAFFCTAAAAHQLRFVFAAADVDVFENLFHRVLIDNRPDVSLFVESRTDTQPLRSINKHVCELLCHLTMNHNARRGGATLTGSAKRAPQHAFKREVEIRVFHDHDHVFATHFERADLIGGSARLTNNAADFG